MLSTPYQVISRYLWCKVGLGSWMTIGVSLYFITSMQYGKESFFQVRWEIMIIRHDNYKYSGLAPHVGGFVSIVFGSLHIFLKRGTVIFDSRDRASISWTKNLNHINSCIRRYLLVKQQNLAKTFRYKNHELIYIMWGGMWSNGSKLCKSNKRISLNDFK